MRRAALILTLFGLVAASCGGSSSERDYDVAIRNAFLENCQYEGGDPSSCAASLECIEEQLTQEEFEYEENWLFLRGEFSDRMTGVLATCMVEAAALGQSTTTHDVAVVPTVPTGCPATDKSDAPRYSFAARPVYCLVSGATYTAVFNTSEGEIRFTLDRAEMPETTNNFVALTRYGYYDNTLLFRIDPSIGIIQGGSPTTNDWSDPGPGYTIPDEGGVFRLTAGGGATGPFSYESGQLVMARSAGLNSSGAQFFFTTTDNVSLLDAQGSYLLFGTTDDAGQTVLDAMMELYVADPESPYGGGPSRELVVHSVTIVEA